MIPMQIESLAGNALPHARPANQCPKRKHSMFPLCGTSKRLADEVLGGFERRNVLEGLEEKQTRPRTGTLMTDNLAIPFPGVHSGSSRY